MELSFFTDLGLSAQSVTGDAREDTAEAISATTARLLQTVSPKGVIAALFLGAPNLTSAFPAATARALGWTETALLCLQDQSLEPFHIRVVLLSSPDPNWVGIRGATTTQTDPIQDASALLQEIQQQNACLPQEIKGILLTVSSDIKPFQKLPYAETLGWRFPLLTEIEMNVSSLSGIIRVLVLAKPTQKTKASYVYLKGTTCLRPDLFPKEPR